MEDAQELLARAAEKHRPYGLDCKCGRPINSDADWSRHLAAEIADFVYLRVDTEEKLKDVYPQSVILDADGDLYAMDEYGHAVLLTGWKGMPYEPPALPARVLWSPELNLFGR
ncbi:Uncharacterised protein [Mycobacteroides abscessus subsp. massiliense]|uniref:hypothetical protein n=1 Tax=Mycobacteroides abscessus TaxID=36809 RepID=UPI0009A5ABBF|nr:hypothetical protein [Mycobacteroides abscessus]SKD94263.1 Uncharacterised protein [Mycobacteroides abscessus subsp. massiliense]SKE07124.1 Uncharacterised protein [Mycobacteroides abscessus subsp. massiliense]SKE08473.1 Uncharacterised protein [Mycobacteroides abscessus subsp. massiliense]SKE60283.1 Uncharacterised protein [Mycobacteroides abscessus subsp. massiliense]SKE62331.1 Uncharacterised protein [Mycobacteroides abscessus subsp. massiliense]